MRDSEFDEISAKKAGPTIRKTGATVFGGFAFVTLAFALVPFPVGSRQRST